MAQVYVFPRQKQLPKGMEAELHRVAKEYIEAIYAIVMLFELEAEQPTYEEILSMVEKAFTDGVYEAIAQLGES